MIGQKQGTVCCLADFENTSIKITWFDGANTLVITSVVNYDRKDSKMAAEVISRSLKGHRDSKTEAGIAQKP